MNRLTSLSILLPALALAQGGASTTASESPSPSSTTEAPTASSRQNAYDVAMVRVPWSEPSGKGFSFGIEEGLWAGFAGSSGVRLSLPVTRSFELKLHGLMPYGGPNDAWAAGGRFELIGRSPVFLNLVRLYGGGGVSYFAPLNDTGASASFGGGGEFGFEFFLARGLSFFLEVGGHSPLLKGARGGNMVLAGMNVYPF